MAEILISEITEVGRCIGLLETIPPPDAFDGHLVAVEDQRAGIEGVDLATDWAHRHREYWMVPGQIYFLVFESARLAWMVTGPGLERDLAHRLVQGDGYAAHLPLDGGGMPRLETAKNYMFVPLDDESARWQVRCWP